MILTVTREGLTARVEVDGPRYTLLDAVSARGLPVYLTPMTRFLLECAAEQQHSDSPKPLSETMDLGTWTWDCLNCNARVSGPVAHPPVCTCHLPALVPSCGREPTVEHLPPDPAGDHEQRVLWCVARFGGSAMGLNRRTIAWVPPVSGLYAALVKCAPALETAG